MKGIWHAGDVLFSLFPPFFAFVLQFFCASFFHIFRVFLVLSFHPVASFRLSTHAYCLFQNCTLCFCAFCFYIIFATLFSCHVIPASLCLFCHLPRQSDVYWFLPSFEPHFSSFFQQGVLLPRIDGLVMPYLYKKAFLVLILCYRTINTTLSHFQPYDSSCSLLRLQVSL